VVAKLNRGTAELRSPQFFIIPTGVLASLSPSGWGKLNFSAIPNFQSYMNARHRIRDFIGAAPPTEPKDEDAGES
jgi:hypothetical protein